MNTASPAIRPEYINACSGNKHMEMLALALELSITAPTDSKSIECAVMAESIASSLNLDQVEICKAIVQKALGLDELLH